MEDLVESEVDRIATEIADDADSLVFSEDQSDEERFHDYWGKVYLTAQEFGPEASSLYTGEAGGGSKVRGNH